MKIRFEYVALTVIVAALVVYLVVKSDDKTHYEIPAVEEAENSEITRIVVERPDSTVIDLVRDDTEWKMKPQGYRAEKSSVDRLADELAGFELTTLVSESETYSRYGLDESGKLKVKAYAGDEMVRDFAIGKPSPTRRHTYVLISDDPSVYEAKNNLRSLFDKETGALRDKTVFTFEGTSVTAITLFDGDKSVTFEKTTVPAPVDPAAGEENSSPLPATETSWTTAHGAEAKAESIKALLNALTSLKCDGYIEGRSKSDFTDPVYSVKLEEREVRSLVIFEKDENDKYPAISSESPYPFLLPEWRANQIMRKPSDLLVQQD
jgi:hypothetical protein